MTKKLSEIATIIMGQSPKSNYYNTDGIGLPFLQGRTTFGEKYPSFDTWTSQWHKEALPGDILFTVRAPVGDINIVPCRMAIGRGLAALRPTKVETQYLFYLLSVNKNKFVSSSSGTIYDSINKDNLENTVLKIHNQEEIQHIVNTIGSIDDLIENYQEQIDKLFNIGVVKINYLNQIYPMIPFTNMFELEKGKEVGSNNYVEKFMTGLIPYIRVGDLLSENYVYVEPQLSDKIASFDDILIAFDGAPGRNNVGKCGYYSSGIYKIISDQSYKGLAYFELNSTLNQQIISSHSYGTTILHASKAISFLQCADCSEKSIEKLNTILSQILLLKQKKNLCLNIKKYLLDKYFTNQR